MNKSISIECMNTFLSPEHPLLPAQERDIVATLSGNIVVHQRLAKAYQALQQVIAENNDLSEPRQAILIGESGCGKTTLLDLVKEELPAKEEAFQLGIRVQQPVLMLSLPSAITPRSMAAQMLRALGDQSTLNGTCQELTERLVHYIKQCNVKVIFIDEFQHLLALGRGTEHGANQRLRAAQNWVKSLIVSTQVTFVLMGMPETLVLIDKEPQLERRFTHLLVLDPFELPSESETQMVAFSDALLDAAIQDLALFDHAEKFATSLDDAIRLYAATQGIPSVIKDLIIRAALTSYRRKSRIITMSDFAAAFSAVRQARLEVEAARLRRNKRRSLLGAAEGRVLNPFSANADELRPIVAQMAA